MMKVFSEDSEFDNSLCPERTTVNGCDAERVVESGECGAQ